MNNSGTCVTDVPACYQDGLVGSMGDATAPGATYPGDMKTCKVWDTGTSAVIDGTCAVKTNGTPVGNSTPCDPKTACEATCT